MSILSRFHAELSECLQVDRVAYIGSVQFKCGAFTHMKKKKNILFDMLSFNVKKAIFLVVVK